MTKIVHIVGTGTIGEPLISLFLRHKEEFGVDEVTFHKNTPLIHDLPKVKQLMELGAILTTDLDKIAGFRALGVDPMYTREEAIQRADVIIDCTPAGLKGKPLYEKYSGQGKLFLAQGSEFGWGKLYARDINEEALTKKDEFIQIASCNTHNIAVLLNTFGQLGKIIDSDFVCIRRANDISQNGGMIPGVEAGKHKMGRFGTHHARDVFELFHTLGKEVKVYSSAVKVPSQYMHSIRFKVRMDLGLPNQLEYVEKALMENRKVCLTNHFTSNKVFSHGREYGHNGRILSQTVVCLPSLQVRDVNPYPQVEITGFCFTPQDGNSLVSSVAVTLWHLYGNWQEVESRLDCLRPYIFSAI